MIENGAYGVLVLGGGNRIVNNITGKRRRRPWHLDRLHLPPATKPPARTTRSALGKVVPVRGRVGISPLKGATGGVFSAVRSPLSHVATHGRVHAGHPAFGQRGVRLSE